MAGDDIVFQFDIAAPPDAVRFRRGDGRGGERLVDRPGGGVRRTGRARRARVPRRRAAVRLHRDRGRARARRLGHPGSARVWQGTRISYDLSAAPGGGTRLFFRHGGFRDDESRAIPAFIWGQLMPLLKRYAETGEPRPFFSVAAPR